MATPRRIYDAVSLPPIMSAMLSGAAISNGEVFWGSGYSNFGGGTPNNALYAFELR